MPVMVGNTFLIFSCYHNC